MIALALLAACALAAYLTRPQQHAVFSDIHAVTCPDADTIDVAGTRVPGGDGLWRYHKRTQQWDMLPSRLVPARYYGEDRLPLAHAWTVICEADDEAPFPADDEGAMPFHEKKRLVQLRVRDGHRTLLGVIRDSPKAADWGVLPDRSGVWAVEERRAGTDDWVRPYIHVYSMRTRRWAVHRCPWVREPQPPMIRWRGVSAIPRAGGWVLIFQRMRYLDTETRAQYAAELWVHLSTGAMRLGELPSSDMLVGFSPDGQYCYLERKILRVPPWPQGPGVVGRTYSALPKSGTLPALWWNGIEGPYWSPDSRHLAYFTSRVPSRAGEAVEPIVRFAEQYSPGWLPDRDTYQYHIVDVTGKEIGTGRGDQWPQFSGRDMLVTVTYRRPGTRTLRGASPRRCWSYYLVPQSGGRRREIFREYD